MAKTMLLFRCFVACLVCGDWLRDVSRLVFVFLHFEGVMVLWFVFECLVKLQMC